MLTLKDELEVKAFEKREYKTVAAAKAAEKKWGPVWEEQTGGGQRAANRT